MKKTYDTPKLTIHGDVKSITQTRGFDWGDFDFRDGRGGKQNDGGRRRPPCGS